MHTGIDPLNLRWLPVNSINVVMIPIETDPYPKTVATFMVRINGKRLKSRKLQKIGNAVRLRY